MASPAAQKRLTREYLHLQKDPPKLILAKPSEGNILTWYYLIEGPPDTAYEGGQYLGVVQFTPQYPFAPPSIRMLTPSGRFAPNTRLCLSISDYHPKSWNPSWNVETILVGLLSFMTGDEITAGSIRSTDAERQRCARASRASNNGNATFRQEFPQQYQENVQRLAPAAAAAKTKEVAREQGKEEKEDRGRKKSGISRDKIIIVCMAVFGYVLLTRALSS